MRKFKASNFLAASVLDKHVFCLLILACIDRTERVRVRAVHEREKQRLFLGSAENSQGRRKILIIFEIKKKNKTKEDKN